MRHESGNTGGMNETSTRPGPIADFCAANGPDALRCEKWTWRAHLPTWIFHEFMLDGYTTWDKVCDAPPFVMIEATGSTSRDLSVEFDDLARGLFYSRDWTSDGLPSIGDGDVYWSGFWFQRMDDANHFLNNARWCGVVATASWHTDHEAVVAEMNRRREGE